MFQGVLNAEGEAEDLETGTKIAWGLKAGQDNMMGKTKKHVVLEFSLFSIVFGSFLIFNIYYWTKERNALSR